MEREHVPPSRRPISRRSLLKASVVAGLGTIALAACTTPPQDKSQSTLLHTAKGEKPKLPKEHGLPDDVLNEKQLKALNITINQTSDVQLHIRKSAIEELKIFQDAKEGKTGGVVISLINDSIISWDSVDKLPTDARLMWQAISLHPSEWSEEKWADVKSDLNKMTTYLQDSIMRNLKSVDRINSGEEEANILYNINYYVGKIRKVENENSKAPSEVIDQYKYYLTYWDERLANLKSGKLLQDEQKSLADHQTGLEKNSFELKIVENKSKRISYFAAQGDALGQFIDPRQFKLDVHSQDFDSKTQKQRYDYVKNHKDWMKKVYIYVCVNGDSKPTLEDSFPTADLFENSKDSKTLFGYHVWEKSGKPDSGFTIRHEIGHYENNLPNRVENEAAADDFGLQTIQEAAKRNTQGDNTGYYFILSTKEGVIYTKRYQKAAGDLRALAA